MRSIPKHSWRTCPPEKGEAVAHVCRHCKVRRVVLAFATRANGRAGRVREWHTRVAGGLTRAERTQPPCLLLPVAGLVETDLRSVGKVSAGQLAARLRLDLADVVRALCWLRDRGRARVVAPTAALGVVVPGIVLWEATHA